MDSGARGRAWQRSTPIAGYDWRRVAAVLVAILLVIMIIGWIVERLDPNEVEVSGASDAVVATEVFDWLAEPERLDRLGVHVDDEVVEAADDGVAVLVTSGGTRFDVVLVTYGFSLDCEYPDLDVTIGETVHMSVIADSGDGCDLAAVPVAIAVDLAAAVEDRAVTAEPSDPRAGS